MLVSIDTKKGGWFLFAPTKGSNLIEMYKENVITPKSSFQ